MANTQSLHALLDQTGWIHALARHLVADPHLAADLAQQTCVDALEREPDTSRPLRGWLATVMRNNLAKLRRTDRHRSAREQDSCTRELEPAVLDVVEKAEIHRNVVQAVLALEEPYRSTLLMRFFEQLSYDEIARRTGVTRASVNSRVTRGLEQLRQRLESTYGGDRRALALALTPLAKLPTGVATTILGVKTMYAAIGTAAAATLLAVTATMTWNGNGAGAPTLATNAPAIDSHRVDFEPASIELEPANTDLEPTGEFDRAPLEVTETALAFGVEGPKQKAKDSNENVWKTELSRVLPISAAVESLAINATSGDIEVTEANGGRLEVLAKVRAKVGVVSNDQLTQVFENHVDVIEEDGVLRIEDKHRDSRGWTVSFVVHVPARLPLHANSGSGDIVVRRAQGPVTANTGSGDVKIDVPNDRIESLSANTGSGNIVAEVSSVTKKLSLNTGSGDVVLRMVDVSSPGSAQLNTGSGDVKLIVPAGINGSFDLETNGDAIEVPRALGIDVQAQSAGKRRAQGSVGGGGGTYKLRSGSGELKVEVGYSLPAKSE